MVKRTRGIAEDKRLVSRVKAELAHEGGTVEQPLATYRIARAEDHVIGAQHLDSTLQLSRAPRLCVAHLEEDVVVQTLRKLAVIGLEALDGVHALGRLGKQHLGDREERAAEHGAPSMECTILMLG